MDKTIAQAMQDFIETITLARSENTSRTYANALRAFAIVLDDHNIPIEKTPAADLKEDAIAWLAAGLKPYAPTTERLYLTAAAGFYEYLAAERLSNPNLPRLRLLIRQRARKQGQRLPQFPRDNIELIIEYANNLALQPEQDAASRLRDLRDRAFLITLADTGLRVHEACALRRGDIDWNEGKAMIIGKGDKQAIVRFSSRTLQALKDYLAQRATLDGASGKPLASLPLFARHDRGAGKKVKPVTPTTGRNIVAQRLAEALGSAEAGTITPHSFRHFFVTTVLRASGGNLKLAQELARHKSIQVTQRYAHLSDAELDEGYWEIFDADKS